MTKHNEPTVKPDGEELDSVGLVQTFSADEITQFIKLYRDESKNDAGEYIKSRMEQYEMVGCYIKDTDFKIVIDKNGQYAIRNTQTKQYEDIGEIFFYQILSVLQKSK